MLSGRTSVIWMTIRRLSWQDLITAAWQLGGVSRLGGPWGINTRTYFNHPKRLTIRNFGDSVDFPTSCLKLIHHTNSIRHSSYTWVNFLSKRLRISQANYRQTAELSRLSPRGGWELTVKGKTGEITLSKLCCSSCRLTWGSAQTHLMKT